MSKSLREWFYNNDQEFINRIYSHKARNVLYKDCPIESAPNHSRPERLPFYRVVKLVDHQSKGKLFIDEKQATY